MTFPAARAIAAACACMFVTACGAAMPGADVRTPPGAEGRSSSRPVLPAERVLAMAEARIDTASLWRHLRVLAHDSMLGRGPGQRGDSLTVRYIEAAFRATGLEPGGTYGYLQPVPLLRATTTARLSIATVDTTVHVAAHELIVQAAAVGSQRLDLDQCERAGADGATRRVRGVEVAVAFQSAAGHRAHLADLLHGCALPRRDEEAHYGRGLCRGAQAGQDVGTTMGGAYATASQATLPRRQHAGHPARIGRGRAWSPAATWRRPPLRRRG
jgi:hypothetical protein